MNAGHESEAQEKTPPPKGALLIDQSPPSAAADKFQDFYARPLL
jgi:hypothetical protein